MRRIPFLSETENGIENFAASKVNQGVTLNFEWHNKRVLGGAYLLFETSLVEFVDLLRDDQARLDSRVLRYLPFCVEFDASNNPPPP